MKVLNLQVILFVCRQSEGVTEKPVERLWADSVPPHSLVEDANASTSEKPCKEVS